MKLELYFAPGACSFVPHVALEAIQAATGQAFEPKMVKLHKGEQKTPEYLALNPNGQVPVLVVDGKPLNQIVAICDYLDRRFPAAGLLPTDPWARAQAISSSLPACAASIRRAIRSSQTRKSGSGGRSRT